MSFWYGIYEKVLWKPNGRIVEIRSGIIYETMSVKVFDDVLGVQTVPLSELAEIDKEDYETDNYPTAAGHGFGF